MTNVCPHCLERLDSTLDEWDIEAVINAVAATSNVPPSLLRTATRVRRVTRLRHVAMAVLHGEPYGLSLAEIGRIFDRDHSSVSHGVKTADASCVAEALTSLGSTGSSSS